MDNRHKLLKERDRKYEQNLNKRLDNDSILEVIVTIFLMVIIGLIFLKFEFF